MNALRSVIFYIGYVLLILFVTVALMPIASLLPYRKRFPVLNLYNVLIVRWFNLVCRVKLTVTGREHLPEQACVIMANHQSEWETLFLQVLRPPVCTVLKQELLNIPLFGWGLRLIRPISLDRSKPTRAIKQVLTQGKQRLEEGLSILIFPEGSRMPPGKTKPFAKSGFHIACRAGVPIVPIAHNAGHCWQGDSLLKRAGRIDVVIGKPIQTQGRDVQEVLKEVELWINTERERLGG